MEWILFQGLGITALTFPRSFRVGKALQAELWIRRATIAETEQDPTWYRRLNYKPRSIIHSNGAIGTDDEPIGMITLNVTVLAQLCVVNPQGNCQEQGNIDLDEIKTPPPTP